MIGDQQSKQQARWLADQFRLGQDVPAALEMAAFVSSLVHQMDGSASPLTGEFGNLLGLMLACQDAHDWLGLADYLEYELVLWLERVEAAD